MAENINPKLEQTINNLLADLDAVDDGKPRYSLLNKMAVIDRALKLEAIKQKLRGDDWGGAFGEDPDDDEQSTTAESDLPPEAETDD